MKRTLALVALVLLAAACGPSPENAPAKKVTAASAPQTAACREAAEYAENIIAALKYAHGQRQGDPQLFVDWVGRLLETHGVTFEQMYLDCIDS